MPENSVISFDSTDKLGLKPLYEKLDVDVEEGGGEQQAINHVEHPAHPVRNRAGIFNMHGSFKHGFHQIA